MLVRGRLLATSAGVAVIIAGALLGLAITVMAVLVGASYLLAGLVPTLGWPAWLNPLSVFWAFGHPYLAWPSTAQWVVLAAVATAGSVAAGAIADRTPKVP